MNCSYHPEHEASAFCVSCGKPICSECSLILPDKKMHCKHCLLSGNASIYKKSSWAWWLLPTLGGIFGGFIAFIANSTKKNIFKDVKRTDYLIVGLLVTILLISVYTVMWYYYDNSFASYHDGYNNGYQQGYKEGQAKIPEKFFP